MEPSNGEAGVSLTIEAGTELWLTGYPRCPRVWVHATREPSRLGVKWRETPLGWVWVDRVQQLRGVDRPRRLLSLQSICMKPCRLFINRASDEVVLLTTSIN